MRRLACLGLELCMGHLRIVCDEATTFSSRHEGTQSFDSAFNWHISYPQDAIAVKAYEVDAIQFGSGRHGVDQIDTDTWYRYYS